MGSMSDFYRRNMRRAERYRKRYLSNSDGASALEFSLIALPFLGIIFGILELALVFFTGSVLTQAISDTGRLVRVGTFQSCGSAAEFKALVCARMNNLMNCDSNLRVDLASSTSFQSVVITPAGDSGLDPNDPDAEIDSGTYVNTGPAEPVVLRGTFYYPLVLPNFMTRLENRPGTGRHVITVSTAFRNEPFPAGGSCSPALRSELDALADANS